MKSTFTRTVPAVDLNLFYAARGVGVSTYYQYTKNRFMEKAVKVKLFDYSGDDITCDVVQEVQDWLMKEFDPQTMWSYTELPCRSDKPIIGYGIERVTMRPEVYTALALKWL